MYQAYNNNKAKRYSIAVILRMTWDTN